jgi:hypothetical protein
LMCSGYYQTCIGRSKSDPAERAKGSRQAEVELWRGSFLRPVNIVTKLGMESFNIKAKHAVYSELSQLSRIAGLKRVSFFGGEFICRHKLLKVI